MCPMKRLRFFEGQFLTAQDLEAEQRYHIQMRWLHNRLLHGYGVVEGLSVSAGDGSSPAVVVSPGLAIDPFGAEIIVEAPVRVDLGTCTGDVCVITIQYTETATDPVPTTGGGVEFSRVTEGFEVRVAAEDTAGDADTRRLSLARLTRGDGGWIVDEAYCRLTVKPAKS
jgi:hypothetical protein